MTTPKPCTYFQTVRIALTLCRGTVNLSPNEPNEEKVRFTVELDIADGKLDEVPNASHKR